MSNDKLDCPDDTIPCPRLDTLPPDTIPGGFLDGGETFDAILDDDTIDLTSEFYED